MEGNSLENINLSFQKELNDLYPKGEIKAIFLLVAEEVLAISRNEINNQGDRLLHKVEVEKINAIIQDLKALKPIQYILGLTTFLGCMIKVNKHVLIPRQETEELVDLTVRECNDSNNLSPKILDIGTGSGCIAIALKKKLPNSIVSAIDISNDALMVAKENAVINNAEISFIKADILDSKFSLKETFDIIVSNPPYIRLSEKDSMSKNVLEHEPHLALFVNDSDPLLFYKHIADFAIKNLILNGKLYFEINEAIGNDLKLLLELKGFKNVQIIKDMSGKERIAIGNK